MIRVWSSTGGESLLFGVYSIYSREIGFTFVDNEFKRPPVLPTGAIRIETSTQVFDRVVVPVHIHFPLMHAPFLLQ